MILFFKKYKAFIYGLLVVRVIIWMLSNFDLILIDNSEVLGNILSFIFCWLLISLPVHYFSFLKEHKKASLKLIGLIVLFFAIIINDANSKIIDNPITFVGLIVVVLSFFYLIAPLYLRKYGIIVFGFYTLALSYFFYKRVYIGDINVYLQQEKEIKIILIFPFFVLFLSWFYQQWKWLKTLESKKYKAELALLKSQINPHFFFNTLNNLYGLTVEKSDDAPDVVLKLSEMMRYTIYMGKEDFVPLKDEIAYLKNYIELHKIRYQKTVNIVFKHFFEEDYEIAPLLLIIPLENAFKHGVEKLTNNAYIDINLKLEDGVIDFYIENNFEKLEVQQTEGIGLTNLKQRLQLLYPNKHSIKVEIIDSIYKFRLKIDTR